MADFEKVLEYLLKKTEGEKDLSKGDFNNMYLVGAKLSGCKFRRSKSIIC